MRRNGIIYLLLVIGAASGYNSKPNRGQKYNETVTPSYFHPTTTTTLRPITHDRTRIIGGVETARNEFPFIVTLSRNGRHFCGGSIINENWVVSAAHCASQPDFALTAGEHDLRIREGTEQTVRAVKVIRHPEYHPVTYVDDICLIKVDPPFKFTKYIQPSNVPDSHFIAIGNVTTAGWGVEEEGSDQVSPVLRKVTIGLFSNIECSKQYGGGFQSHKMICAGIPDIGGKDACQGDSGGPLLADNHHGSPTLCGIVSFGFGCARPDFVGVYTKVAHYSDWIQYEQRKDANPNNPLIWDKPGDGTSTIPSNGLPTQMPEIVLQGRTSRRPRGWRNGSTTLTSSVFVFMAVIFSWFIRILT